MSYLSLQGEKWCKTETWMIQQGHCSILCCNTILTVTEGQDGNYCINSSARCFLGFAGGGAISILVKAR